jgi:hypothetical protein
MVKERTDRGAKAYILPEELKAKAEALYRGLTNKDTVADFIKKYLEEHTPTADQKRNNYINLLASPLPYVWQAGFIDEGGIKIGIVQGFDIRPDSPGPGKAKKHTLHFLFSTSDHTADFMWLHDTHEIRWQMVREAKPKPQPAQIPGRQAIAVLDRD